MTTPLAKCSAALAATLTLSACVSAPSGPSVLVLPGSRADFEAFQNDDDTCREFAERRSGGRGDAEDAVVRDVAIATAVGAAAGAAIGAVAGTLVMHDRVLDVSDQIFEECGRVMLGVTKPGAYWTPFGVNG